MPYKCPHCHETIAEDPHKKWGNPFACPSCGTLVQFDWFDEVQLKSDFFLTVADDSESERDG